MEKAATASREIKRKRSRLPGNKMTPLMAIIIVLLFIYFLLVAYPLFWMICNSLKSYKEIYKNIWAMPKSPLWNNYALAWQRGISKYFLNSVLVTGSDCRRDSGFRAGLLFAGPLPLQGQPAHLHPVHGRHDALPAGHADSAV